MSELREKSGTKLSKLPSHPVRRACDLRGVPSNAPSGTEGHQPLFSAKQNRDPNTATMQGLCLIATHSAPDTPVIKGGCSQKLKKWESLIGKAGQYNQRPSASWDTDGHQLPSTGTKTVLSTNNMTDTLSHTLDVQRSGVLMFERNLFKMNKNVFANKWILDQGASQGKQVPQVSTCRLLQQRLYPVCPQLRQKHWLEGGKHNPASLNLNLNLKSS